MVLDSRVEQLADLVLSHSVNIQTQDTLWIRSERYFEQFAQLVAQKAGERGARVIADYYSPSQLRSLIEGNDSSKLEEESERQCRIAEQATAAIRVNSQSDPYYLEGIDPSKIADYGKVVTSPVVHRIIGDGDEFSGIKWNLVAFPCEGEAKKAGMDLSEYTDMVFNAVLQDLSGISGGIKKYADMLNGAEEVRVLVPGLTDLRFSLRDRGAYISDGRHNLPDGEFFFGPVEDSVQGYIHFPYPATRDSNTVSGVLLQFKNGRVTDFKAEQNQQYLEQMLDLNGARALGEFGVGFNPGITRYINNMIFLEKMKGTAHFALGQSFNPPAHPLSNGGGLNKSDLHWDLVCELRPINRNPGGIIYVNDKPIQQNGAWL